MTISMKPFDNNGAYEVVFEYSALTNSPKPGDRGPSKYSGVARSLEDMFRMYKSAKSKEEQVLGGKNNGR